MIMLQKRNSEPNMSALSTRHASVPTPTRSTNIYCYSLFSARAILECTNIVVSFKLECFDFFHITRDLYDTLTVLWVLRMLTPREFHNSYQLNEPNLSCAGKGLGPNVYNWNTLFMYKYNTRNSHVAPSCFHFRKIRAAERKNWDAVDFS